MDDRIRKVEPIPDRTRVNPEYISKREPKGNQEFRSKLDEEIKKRIQKQKKR